MSLIESLGVSVYWKKVTVSTVDHSKYISTVDLLGLMSVGNADVGEGEINKVNGCGHRQVHLNQNNVSMILCLPREIWVLQSPSTGNCGGFDTA